MKKNKNLAKTKKSGSDDEENIEITILPNKSEKLPKSNFLMNKKKREKVKEPEEEYNDINMITNYENNLNIEENVNENISEIDNSLDNFNNFNNFTNQRSTKDLNIPLSHSNNFMEDAEDKIPVQKFQRNNFKSINFSHKANSLYSLKKDMFKSQTNFDLIKEMDDIKNISTNPKSFYSRQKTTASSEFVKRALEGLKIEDEMVVLSVLSELSSELSMASETVGDDINIHYLIKELILLFDKYYMLPDISMSSLTCLNYILDLNVRLTSSIVKHGGVKKIVGMTQNIDYIDCAENAIKAIEKMSFENPFLILEMDAFQSILSLIDFFDLNLRKSALRACVNMSKAFNGVEQVKRFVFPALPSLANLTKYSGNSEIEKNNLELAVQCYYNIINHVKVYNTAGNNENFLNSLIQFGFLENIFELFVNFLGADGNEDKSENISTNGNYTMNMQIETFKNIIRIFEMICSLSAEITNSILNWNILEILHTILSKELSLDSTRKKLSSGSASCYIEIFNLLISFFPNKKSKQPDRLLSENNKHFYNYFSENILSFLLNNIVNISSSNTMVSVVKLVEMFIKNSNEEYVQKYIDPAKLSNIAGKMLDSRDSSYIFEIFNLVEIIMNKVPENFLISFLREGVVDNIKTLSEIEDSKLYIPNDTSKIISSTNYLYSDYSQMSKNVQFIDTGNDESYGDDAMEEDEIVEDWDLNSKDGSENTGNSVLSNSGVKNSLIKDKLIESVMVDDRQKEFLDFINKKMEMKSSGNPKGSGNISKTSNTNPYDNKLVKNPKDEHIETKVAYNPFASKTIISENPNQTPIINSSNTNAFQSFVNLAVSKEQENSHEILTSNSNSNLSNPIVLEKPSRKSTQDNPSSTVNSIATLINIKAKEIIEKYFSEENIDKFIQKSNKKVNPREILQRLSNIKEILQNPEKVDLSVLSFLFEIILSKDKLTFYEIEKSEVILYLTKYLDQNFFQNYEDTTETDYKTTSNISGFYNKKIINNLKLLINAMNNDLNKINEFMKILQYCISSMNCFKLFLYDTGNSKYASLMLTQFKTPKLRMKFAYVPDDINSKHVEEEIPAYKELFNYFKNNKNVTLVFEQSENFQNVFEALIKFGKEIKESNPQQTLGMKEDYFEEIFTHFNNRKGSEEDIQFTQRMLQRLIERKKSANSQDKEENIQLNKEDLNIHKNSQSNISTEIVKEEGINLASPCVEANFYVVINDNRMDIKNDWSIVDFVRELKSFYKRNEYTTFVSDMQISFNLKIKDNTNLMSNITGYSQDINATYDYPAKITLDVESNLENIKKGIYENMLFERYYRDNLINNSSLYCIKRASPFFYLISLLEMGINNFRSLFEINEDDSNLNSLANLENMKVTTLLFKQAKDPFSISSGNLPKWCKELCHSFTYLAGFNSRYLLFKVSSFDNKRSLSNLYIYLKNFMGEAIVEDKTLSQNKRHRFKIDRANIIKDTEKLMKEFHDYKGYLEFEYHDEVGTGLGPTLEYYSLFAKEIKNINNLWYKTDDYSLFPCPIDVNDHEKTEQNIKLFELLGFVIARGLYDDRLIDFPINSLFWDLVLDRPISFDKIKKIDKNLGKTINDFQSIIVNKQRVINNPKFINNNSDLNDFIKYKNVRIEDLSLTFTLPGYEKIELKKGGEDTLLTVHNIEEYTSLVFDKLVWSGCRLYIEAFKAGFNKVFPITNMKTFTSPELEDIICGCAQDKWEHEALIENIIPAHGYHKNSQIFKGLIDIMINMDSIGKKKFLLFSTGSPRLPLEGFKNLTPKLTVVLKLNHLESHNPDHYLPTVMTCQNFLKIPEYSNVDILKEKLLLAMEEGSNAFHLS